MTIGTMLAFTMLADDMAEPVQDLVNGWDELQEVFNAVERLGDIRQKAPELIPYEETRETIRLPAIQGNIRFNRLTFRYEPDDRSNVLQNFSLEIAAGEKVAFVGRSGCGKSTIVMPPSSR